MAEVVVMPQLGNTVESCLVTSWHVSVGDAVEANTVVADIETDKSAMEVPAGVAGTVLALLAGPGDEVPVKAPFLIVGQPGEDISALVPPKPGETAPAPAVPPADSAPEAPVWVDLSAEPAVPPEPAAPAVVSTEPAVSAATPTGGPASPRARRVAEEAGVDIRNVVGTGPNGRILESDVRDHIASHGDLDAARAQNELVRSAEGKEEVEARSAEHGSTVTSSQMPISAISDNEAVPLTQAAVSEPPRTRAAEGEPLTGIEYGTGIGGRVTRQDIEESNLAVPTPPVETQVVPPVQAAAVPAIQPAVPSAPAASPAPAPVVPPAPPVVQPTAAQPTAPAEQADFPGPYTDTPVTGIRKIVAERMLASLAAHAQLTFDSSASAESLLELRAKMKNSNPALGMTGVTIGDLVAYAAVRVATRFPAINATFQNKVLRSYENVHLGLAVDTPRGLLVPTIRYASSMSLSQFSAQAKALAAQAQSGNINPDLLAGGTFTVTNLGAYGIESFTPILNSPQTAILGVNMIQPKPIIAPDGSVKVERRISFSLTVDHSVVDGADAARFLQALTAYISQIEVAILAEGGINA